jgi:hypothetical protein
MTPGVEQTATELDLPLSSADRNLNSGSGSIEHQAAILATMQTTGWED